MYNRRPGAFRRCRDWGPEPVRFHTIQAHGTNRATSLLAHFSLILEKEYLLKKNLTTTFKLGQLRLFVQLQKVLNIWLVRVL